MAKKATKTGKELEQRVADAYRAMGACKVEHDVELAGDQIDVYVELETSGGLLHRIAVEAKDWDSTVGKGIVNNFALIVKLLRSERLIDEGIIVSARGFTRPARKAAETYGIRLLELADLTRQQVVQETARIVRELFKGRVRVVDEDLFQHPASEEEINEYYSRARLTWNIVAAQGIIKRDQQVGLLERLTTPTGQTWMMCIVGESGAGKSSLAWQLAYELTRQQDNPILQILDNMDDDIWYRLFDFWARIQQPFYVLVDDAFRDDNVLRALKGLDPNLPLTILATSRTNEYRGDERLPFPVERVDLLEPSPAEKTRILSKLDKERVRLTAEQRARVGKANQFLVLMMELMTGKELIEIIRDTLDRLKQQDEVVYRAYEYLCYTCQYDISMPVSLLERLDDKGRFYHLLDKKASRGLIFTDEQRSGNLQVGHSLIAEHSARLYGRDPRSVFGEILGAVDTNAWVERRFVVHLLREMARCASEARLADILEREAVVIQNLQREATISELSIWRALYQSLGRQEEAECYVDMALNKEPTNGIDCIVLLAFSQERGQEATLLPRFRQWLQRMPEDHHVRVAYLGLVERKGTDEQMAQVLAETVAWLADHLQDNYVRGAYLGLVKRKGTAEQVAQAVGETGAWLADHPQDSSVRQTYLGLVERKGTAEQVAQAVGETGAWLADHPRDINVRERYLGLVERKGTAEQVAQALAETGAWLADHPRDINVRTAYLGLVECKGTAEQVAQVLAETSAWLADHPRDINVHERYLGLVECKGTAGQVAQVLAETGAWLADHPRDINVRTVYLGLVERKGTVEQVAQVLAETSVWLADHPQDNYVRGAYLGLVERKGTVEQKAATVEQTRQWLANYPQKADVPVLYGYGRLLLALEEFAEAAKKFRAVLKIHKGHTAARRGLALALNSLGEFRQAESEFKHALWWAENVTDYPASILYHDLGLFYLEQGRYAAARSAFEKAIGEYPEGFANYWHLGEVLMAQGDYRNAVDALQTALDKAPEDPELRAREEIVALLNECEEQLGA